MEGARTIPRSSSNIRRKTGVFQIEPEQPERLLRCCPDQDLPDRPVGLGRSERDIREVLRRGASCESRGSGSGTSQEGKCRDRDDRTESRIVSNAARETGQETVRSRTFPGHGRAGIAPVPLLQKKRFPDFPENSGEYGRTDVLKSVQICETRFRRTARGSSAFTTLDARRTPFVPRSTAIFTHSPH